MNEIEFEQEMLKLRWFKTKLDGVVIGAYWESLQHVPLSNFKAAITWILQEEKSFPTTSRIKRVIKDLSAGQDPRFAKSGSQCQSFHCGDCDIDFSVILTSDERKTIRCQGDGTSTCGRTWTIGELNTLLLDARERQQDIIVL